MKGKDEFINLVIVSLFLPSETNDYTILDLGSFQKKEKIFYSFHKSKIIDKDKILKVDTKFARSHKFFLYYTYCENNSEDIQKAKNLIGETLNVYLSSIQVEFDKFKESAEIFLNK